MMLTCSLPPTNFDRPSIKLRAFSSSSRTRSAILGLLISSAAQTSAATNHGSPSMTITRSGFSSKEKIDGTDVPWADADMALLLVERLQPLFSAGGGQALKTATSRRAYFPFGSCISLTPAHSPHPTRAIKPAHCRAAFAA